MFYLITVLKRNKIQLEDTGVLISLILKCACLTHTHTQHCLLLHTCFHHTKRVMRGGKKSQPTTHSMETLTHRDNRALFLQVD